ncbi:TatD family hydrolase [Mucilaginibacter gotjawali]|uniref:TatD DNase family protein n=2 Tax=Mucilaginibacter gotjawali TaxID=1550579 RepID=A0A839SLF7_9SPHI|nr:TatD family hydrolase [Mucilaginibacter gotjawali]MBB3058074.1 TatD DNase family protein [Mucilaginibacter gotjawali]BAU52049.1 putative deoxyribonuclease YcfH [Mucilaginibacter gotjawali]
MLLTDTHTHLYYETDLQKRAGLVERCISNNVERLFLPNVDAASVPKVFDLAATCPDMFYPMLGLHPCSVKDGWEEELNTIKQAAGEHKIYAIGEIGIDLYWDKTTLAEQVKAFKAQIAWAKQLKLPIVIHCREAFNEVFEVLQQEQGKDLRGIFHCFTGNLEQAHKVIELGFYLGIGGVVTYKNAGLAEVVAQIDLNRIVLETDSPYLAPVPHRGKPNESAFLVFVAQKVADALQVSIEKVATVTTENSKLIFGV